MKHLLLFFLFSGSLDGFSQVKNDALRLGKDSYLIHHMDSTFEFYQNITPDTFRCTLFVYYDRGPSIVHTKPGFVVKQSGKDNIYLDDRKREIKAPLEVDHYKLKK